MRKPVTNENPVLQRRKVNGDMSEMLRFCRKGLPGVQRRPYGIATTAPLQDESGSVATPGGPYGMETHHFLA